MLRRGLQLHLKDNVAVATGELFPGMEVAVNDEVNDERLRIAVCEHIPFGHKFALKRIAAGQEVVKYGHAIGRATVFIEPGCHVHLHNVASDHRSGQRFVTVLDEGCTQGYCEHTATSVYPTPTFLGFRRRDGRVGVRNYVLVLPTVHCVSGVVKRIGREVPEVVAIPHIYGCSQIGEDVAQTRLVLEHYAGHPNVGACLLVGLGCEVMPTAEIARTVRERGGLVQFILIQEAGGSRAAVERGVGIVRELLKETGTVRREPVPVSELVVGVECGGSDAWSGITANPAVGVVSDILVSQGATVILSEVTEFIGAEHILVERAMSPLVARGILEAVARRESAAQAMGVEIRRAQLSPGNMAGGLTTLEEKSFGAIAKGGTARIREFLAYGQQPRARGLVVMDTSGNDLESVTGMVAGGAQVILFTTGRGTPMGNPVAPVIKVASNSAVFERLADDLDINAGAVIEGDPLHTVGRRIFELLLMVASGMPTAADRWGHWEFAIEPRGPRV